jgi:hypothetical protein
VKGRNNGELAGGRFKNVPLKKAVMNESSNYWPISSSIVEATVEIMRARQRRE